MKKFLLPIIALFLTSFVFVSCQKDKEDLSGLDKGYAYFPLEIGKYVLYDVDSTYWDDFLRAEIHHRCQLRYEVVDTFNSGGELAYVINVLYRQTSADPFVPNDVIYASANEDRAVLTQGNVPFIKMTFPVKEGKTWDGNAMIPLSNDGNEQYRSDKWIYQYAQVNELFDPGNNVYEHTVTVNQIDDELNNPEEDPDAYAYKNYSQEKYAYNVGLIYKERIYWVYQPTSPDGQSGGSGYRKGYGVIMKAVDNN